MRRKSPSVSTRAAVRAAGGSQTVGTRLFTTTSVLQVKHQTNPGFAHILDIVHALIRLEQTNAEPVMRPSRAIPTSRANDVCLLLANVSAARQTGASQPASQPGQPTHTTPATRQKSRLMRARVFFAATAAVVAVVVTESTQVMRFSPAEVDYSLGRHASASPRRRYLLACIERKNASRRSLARIFASAA